MKKQSFTIAAALALASISAVAGGSGSHGGNGGGGNAGQFRSGDSSVTFTGSTSAVANGKTVAVWGDTTVEGTHKGPNGTTHFLGTNGFEASGQGTVNGRSFLTGGEVRTVDRSTSRVNNSGNMNSNAYAADPRTYAWGEMRFGGNLLGKNPESSLQFNQGSGYDALSTYRANGAAQQDFGAVYRIGTRGR